MSIRAKHSTIITNNPDAGELPISLTEAKEHLRILDGENDDDALIYDLILDAAAYVEAETKIKLIDQTVTLRLDCFTSMVHLHVGPVTAVNSIYYYDSNNAYTPLNPSEYYEDLNGVHSKVLAVDGWPSTYPRPNAVEIELQVGYANARAVPRNLKRALRLIVAEWWENTEGSVKGAAINEVKAIPINALLAPFKLRTIK